MIACFFEQHNFKQVVNRAITDQDTLLDNIYYNNMSVVINTEMCDTFKITTQQLWPLEKIAYDFLLLVK